MFQAGLSKQNSSCSFIFRKCWEQLRRSVSVVYKQSNICSWHLHYIERTSDIRYQLSTTKYFTINLKSERFRVHLLPWIVMVGADGEVIFSGWLISHKERCNIYYDHDSVTNRGWHVSHHVSYDVSISDICIFTSYSHYPIFLCCWADRATLFKSGLRRSIWIFNIYNI